MIAAFDLDGTLVDTYEAVLAAYRSVGVEPPPGWWGKPWKQWLDSKEAHQNKNDAYPLHLHLAKVLPATSLLRLHARAKDEIFVLTGASRESAHQVARRFLPIGLRITAELDRTAKISKLESILRTFNQSELHYYDDEVEALEEMRFTLATPRFQPIHVEKETIRWLSR